VDEEHLVALAVAIERVFGQRLAGADDAHQHVVVEEQRDAAVDDVAARGHGPRLHQTMAMNSVIDRLVVEIANSFNLMRTRRRDEVIEQR
jgi:hypothetical protein